MSILRPGGYFELTGSFCSITDQDQDRTQWKTETRRTKHADVGYFAAWVEKKLSSETSISKLKMGQKASYAF